MVPKRESSSIFCAALLFFFFQILNIKTNEKRKKIKNKDKNKTSQTNGSPLCSRRQFWVAPKAGRMLWLLNISMYMRLSPSSFLHESKNIINSNYESAILNFKNIIPD